MIRLFFLLLAILLLPLATLSAEVLQVNSYNRLLIGDNNRSYKVKIACIEALPNKENLAFNWLREELPRKTKVNIKPKAFMEGVLIASLIDVKSKKDLGKSMEIEGLARLDCSE